MKSAIIGCGSIAAVHAKSITGLGGCELTAVADVIPERAEAMAREYGAVPYTDWGPCWKKRRLMSSISAHPIICILPWRRLR